MSSNDLWDDARLFQGIAKPEPISRRFYFTAQGKEGTYHSTSGYAFGVTPFAALASACEAIRKERPKQGGTFEISMATNDNDKGPWLTHWFGGVDVLTGTYREHVDTQARQ